MTMTLATLLKFAKMKCVACSLVLLKMDGCMGAQWVVFFTAVIYLYFSLFFQENLAGRNSVS